MREMYLRGDIADETEPKSNKTARVTYASSSGAGLKQQKLAKKSIMVGSDGEIDWSAVQQQPKATIPKEENSVNDFAEDGIDNSEVSGINLEELKKSYKESQESMRSGLKSAMKRPVEPKMAAVPEEEKTHSVAETESSGTVPIPVGRFANVKFQEGF